MRRPQRHLLREPAPPTLGYAAMCVSAPQAQLHKGKLVRLIDDDHPGLVEVRRPVASCFSFGGTFWQLGPALTAPPRLLPAQTKWCRNRRALGL